MIYSKDKDVADFSSVYYNSTTIGFEFSFELDKDTDSFDVVV